MAHLVINQFGGVIPRYLDTVINANMASDAVNVKLSNGGLEPFRYPARVVEIGDTKCIQSLFRAKCCWLVFENPCVSVAQWLPTCERAYVTELADYPVVSAVKEDCSWDWKRVGLPIPDEAITAQRESTEDMKPHISGSRTYIFTYVNSFGEESCPSFPSEAIQVNEGDKVVLTLPTHGYDASWDVQSIRLYRSGASFIDGTKPVDENVSEAFYFVDEIDAQQSVYEDVMPSDGLMEANIHYQFTPPPKGLKNITALPDGVLAGSVGNQIWFSEPYQPQAWPVDYMLALDDNVIALKYATGTLFALTDGHPYAVGEKVQEESKLRQVRRFEKSAPIVSKQSAVAMHQGVVYACQDGLMLLAPNNMSLLTAPWFSRDDWQAVLPHTLIGAIVQNQYIGFSRAKGFIFSLRDSVENDGINDNDFMPLDLTPNALFTDRDGSLFMAFGHVIHEWDKGDAFMPFRWKSKINHLGGASNFGAAKVTLSHYAYPYKTSEPVSVSFVSDGRAYFKRPIHTSMAFRLPANRRYVDIDIAVEGTESIRQIELATSMNELSAV